MKGGKGCTKRALNNEIELNYLFFLCPKEMRKQWQQSERLVPSSSSLRLLPLSSASLAAHYARRVRYGDHAGYSFPPSLFPLHLPCLDSDASRASIFSPPDVALSSPQRLIDAALAFQSQQLPSLSPSFPLPHSLYHYRQTISAEKEGVVPVLRSLDPLPSVHPARDARGESPAAGETRAVNLLPSHTG